jgi:hypothetical protein
MADDERAHTVMGKTAFTKLVQQIKAAKSRIAGEQGALGAKIKAAEEKDQLNKVVLPLVIRLEAMNDPAKQSRCIREFNLYCDHLGLGGQQDIEDAIDARSGEDDDGGDEGDPDAELKQVVDAVTGNGAVDDFDQGVPDRELTVRKFRDMIMTETADSIAVRRALDVFVQAHPALAGEAEEIVARRLAELAAAANKPTRIRRGRAGEQPGDHVH